MKVYSGNMSSMGGEAVQQRYLDINPEGILLQEAQDISEELMIMKRIYSEQLKVVKDFKRHLAHPLGQPRAGEGEDLVQRLLHGLDSIYSRTPGPERDKAPVTEAHRFNESVHEAHVLVELMESRHAEIQDLEEAALRACHQVRIPECGVENAMTARRVFHLYARMRSQITILAAPRPAPVLILAPTAILHSC